MKEITDRDLFIEQMGNLSAQERLVRINNGLILLSREIFDDCCVNKTQAGFDRLQILKSCFLTLAGETRRYLDKLGEFSKIFPEHYILGLSSLLERELTEVDLSKNFIELIRGSVGLHQLQGMTALFNVSPDLFVRKTTPAIETVKSVYENNGFSFFFGNVSGGNFDAAYLTNSCCRGGSEELLYRYRLYQYSRKAEIKGQTIGFRSVEAEFEGVETSGICIVDSFCAGGRSIEESIKGFRQLTKGNIYIFISSGFKPYLIDGNINLKQLWPKKEIFLYKESEMMFFKVV